jgi:protein-S-isoprenylcysteine O-methyltransferase Ste14
MKLFTDWGFTLEGFRQGTKGEYWVIAQGLLLLVFLLLPIQRFPTAGIPYALLTVLLITALVFLLLALLLIVKALLDLGNSLTPLPYPRTDGQLVQTGIYGVVRHPLYAGVIMGALGYAIYQLSIWHIVGAIALFGFFNAKANREEQWLTERYPEYPQYQQTVKKLLPWIY